MVTLLGRSMGRPSARDHTPYARPRLVDGTLL